MRTVLVCVRTPLAAQTIASCAARLGAAAVVRTAVSEIEVMARLAERVPDALLVDAALARPDPVAFTRRVLARAPRATIVLLGDQEPRVAAAAVAAGARGVIRGTGQDLVTAVTKTLLLLCLPNGGVADSRRGAEARSDARGAGVGPGGKPKPLTALPGVPTTEPVTPDASTADASTADASTTPASTTPASTADASTAEPAAAGRPAVPAAMALPAGTTAVVPQQRSDFAPGRGRGGKRLTLTERELQVLRGMADGKSNAEIGRELYVSEDTVKTHARRLFRKLGARDRAHAVASGFRAGLVT